ncbi:MAG: acyl carrier protein [Myxococcota bacterium]
MEENIAQKVKQIVADQLGILPEKIDLGAKFTDDLEMDSLDVVEMVLAFEEKFQVKIPDDEVKNIVTVGEAIAYIEAHQDEEKSESQE